MISFTDLECVHGLLDDSSVQSTPPFAHTPVLIIPHQSKTGDQLDQLGTEHGRGRDEHVPWPGPEAVTTNQNTVLSTNQNSPGISHTQPQHSILASQSHQAEDNNLIIEQSTRGIFLESEVQQEQCHDYCKDKTGAIKKNYLIYLRVWL